MNPRCPPTLAATKATTAEVDQSEAAEELERRASPKDQSWSLSLFFFLKFLQGALHSHQNTYGIADAIGVLMKYNFRFTYAIDTSYFTTPFHES